MKRTAGCLLLAGALSLSACSTINPYTGEKQTSKAAGGAAIGAVSGALIGIATSDSAKERKERALAGAGIGAIAGGGVGYYMDVQEAKLRQKLEGSGVSVTRNGDNIILNMPGNVTFDTDSTQVKSSFRSVLDSVSEVLKEYDSTMLQIAGPHRQHRRRPLQPAALPAARPGGGRCTKRLRRAGRAHGRGRFRRDPADRG